MLLLSGVFGGLDLHGKPRNVTWTRLAVPASVGDTEITLETNVDWDAGDEIIIVTTSYSPHEGEVFTITAVSQDGRTISLNGSCNYPHIGRLPNSNSNSNSKVFIKARNKYHRDFLKDNVYIDAWGIFNTMGI